MRRPRHIISDGWFKMSPDAATTMPDAQFASLNLPPLSFGHFPR